MRFKFLIIFIILFLGTIPLNSSAQISIAEDISVPAPEFLSVGTGDIPSDNLIFNNGSEVFIKYEADRYEVEGLILLGTGRNYKFI